MIPAIWPCQTPRFSHPAIWFRAKKNAHPLMLR